jgi:hypothetical protein
MTVNPDVKVKCLSRTASLYWVNCKDKEWALTEWAVLEGAAQPRLHAIWVIMAGRCHNHTLRSLSHHMLLWTGFSPGQWLPQHTTLGGR